MRQSKLIGARLLGEIAFPKVPNVIILGKNDNVKDLSFEEGDILDATSIKQIASQSGSGGGGSTDGVTFSDLASHEKLGIVKIGSNINVSNSGIINVEAIDTEYINNL